MENINVKSSENTQSQISNSMGKVKPTESGSKRTYTVQRGDTLTKIAKEELNDASRYVEIVELNDIVDPDVILVGDEYILPDADKPANSVETVKTEETEEVITNTVEEKENIVSSVKEEVKSTEKNDKDTSFAKLNQYAIEPHSRIDTVEGERERRIQYLTDGATSEAELYALMTEIEVPVWNGTEVASKKMIVNEKLASTIKSIFYELADKKYPIEFDDDYGYEVEGYEYRPTGSGRLSDHAYGGAIDINARHNPLTGPKDALVDNDGSPYVVTDEVVQIFAKHGFYWGGDWNSSNDAMHFTFTGW